MTRRVAIVTDSTASVPDSLVAELDISVVQLELMVGNEYNDERRIPHADLADAMRRGTPVATSPPPPAAFYWSYMDAVAAGAEAIVSIHLSEALSQTCEAARTAAAQLNVPVYVVDSRLAGMSTGYSVIAAAEAAKAGASVQTVLQILERRMASTCQMIYVDTLEYLRRSGRVSPAKAIVGETLSVKPVLIMKDGELDPLVTGIGAHRTLKRAVGQAAARAGNGPVDIAVEYFQFEDADRVLKMLQARVPRPRRVTLEFTSAIIGAHAGPGAIGITVSPADEVREAPPVVPGVRPRAGLAGLGRPRR